MSPDPRASSRPTRADDRASARPPEDADVGTVGDEPGLLERAGSAASNLGSRLSDAAGDALEPSQSSGDTGGSLFEMGGGGDRGPSALDQLGDDRDRRGGDDDEPPVIDDIDRFEDGVFLNGNTANDDGGGA